MITWLGHTRRTFIVPIIGLCLAIAPAARAADEPATQPVAGSNHFPSPAELMNKLKASKKAVDGSDTSHVAYFDLRQPLTEKPADFSLFASDQADTLHTLLVRLEKARTDKSIQGVLITLGDSGANMSQALEIRDALLALKEAGKRTFVYADSFDTHGYIIASGASDICLLGGGEIELPGVGLETMFAKGLLDKVGVEADYEQIGEYKGADEEYIHTEPSPELRGELDRLVDSIYGQVVSSIASARNLTPDQVKQVIDQSILSGEQAKTRGLVDHLVDVDGLRDLITDELGTKLDLVHDYGQPPKDTLDLSSPFAIFKLLAKQPEVSTRQAVGLIYAEGVIVDGSSGGNLLQATDNIGSDDMRKAIRTAMRDDNVKAVVIRIDSPGGSALASEAMWQAVRRLDKTKPVVISVGSMAASGGYYLASSGDYIYADATAIVGSIGVVGGKFVMKDLFNKIGLNTTEFTRGANASLFSSNEPWSDTQRKQVHDWMHDTYVQFTQRVMTTRTGKIQDIDKVARGRIFLAQQAKDLGMVDAIGGINDAIAYAAGKANMDAGSYDVRAVPEPKTLADLINGTASEATPVPAKMSLPGGVAEDSLLRLLPASKRELLEEQVQVLQLLQDKHVALVSPFVVTVK